MAESKLISTILMDNRDRLVITLNVAGQKYYRCFDDSKKTEMTSVLSFSKIITGEDGKPVIDPTQTLSIGTTNEYELSLKSERGGIEIGSMKIACKELDGTSLTLYHMMKSVREIDSILQISAVSMSEKKVAKFRGAIVAFFKKYLYDKTRDAENGLVDMDILILSRISKEVHLFINKILSYSKIMTLISNKILERGGVSDAFNEISTLIHDVTGQNIINDDNICEVLKEITGYSDMELREKYGPHAKFKFSSILRGIKRCFTIKGTIIAIQLTGAALSIAAVAYRIFTYRSDVDVKELGMTMMMANNPA